MVIYAQCLVFTLLLACFSALQKELLNSIDRAYSKEKFSEDEKKQTRPFLIVVFTFANFLLCIGAYQLIGFTGFWSWK